MTHSFRARLTTPQVTRALDPQADVVGRSRRRGLCARASTLALALCAVYPSEQAHAQSTVHWDGGTVDGGNPAPDANGGTGTWNNTTTNWDTSATGGGSVVWTSGDNAVFGGTAGTVTLGAPITARSLAFQSNGYTLNGNTLTLTGVSPTISYTGANTATINSVLAAATA